ncbi:MAG: DUF3500 domain-containing protein [Candidatus Promineifilaceae bacterium]
MNKVSFLFITLVLFAAGCGVFGVGETIREPVDLATCGTETANQSADAEIEALRTAMNAFRSSLSDSLLAQASNCLDDERLYLWHNTPADGNRDGITYGDLSAEQLASFQALLQAFLSADGYQKVDEITFLAEGYLSEIRSIWDTDSYSIDMFGDPENNGSWGFQLDGHHAALNFLVHGDSVSIVPAFLGGEPTVGSHNGVEFDIFSAERDRALTLYNNLNTDENTAAVSTGDSATMLVGPANRNGNPDPYIGAYDYSGFETGLKYADMSETTQANLLLLMQAYVYNLNTPFADVWWADIMTSIDDTYFVWLDDVETPTATTQFYYRIYNQSVWIEYNMESPRGQGLEDWNHVHTITRIPSNANGGDYGIFANVINQGGPTTLLEHYMQVDHHALSEIEFDYGLDTPLDTSHAHDS